MLFTGLARLYDLVSPLLKFVYQQVMAQVYEPTEKTLKMTSSASKDVSQIIKFNGANFPSCKFEIWMFLEKHKLNAVANGTETKPR